MKPGRFFIAELILILWGNFLKKFLIWILENEIISVTELVFSYTVIALEEINVPCIFSWLYNLWNQKHKAVVKLCSRNKGDCR